MYKADLAAYLVPRLVKSTCCFSFIFFLHISIQWACTYVLCASVYYISKVDLATRLTARLAKCGTFRDARNIWSLASVFKWNVLLEIYCLEGQSQTCSESSLYWIATSYILGCNSIISPSFSQHDMAKLLRSTPLEEDTKSSHITQRVTCWIHTTCLFVRAPFLDYTWLVNYNRTPEPFQ